MIAEMKQLTSTEHPADVLGQITHWHNAGLRTALVMLIGADGGAVRAPGAVMAVCEGGDHIGYLSGGCIDADLILQAERALSLIHI